MIRCFVMMCLVAHPNACKPREEIVPQDDHMITAPMECMRGGAIYFSKVRILQQTPEGKPPPWFARIWSELDGDGSDIVKTWLAEQRARRTMDGYLSAYSDPDMQPTKSCDDGTVCPTIPPHLRPALDEPLDLEAMKGRVSP